MADTKRKFYEAFRRPVAGIYNTVIQELLVQQHIMRYNRAYSYDAVRLFRLSPKLPGHMPLMPVHRMPPGESKELQSAVLCMLQGLSMRPTAGTCPCSPLLSSPAA